ncbi:PP2C family serine/threonine-protein phosphatase [Eikenella longinqua]|uniref:PP2C family serine/threonine-protein phosphatase n=1 Tax=Eikenella longinqua TaxID=1795827 RepID=UPI001FDF11B4|nr:PP2C family serine/threonine-protein phosphatase [Eikenella longinqua]
MIEQGEAQPGTDYAGIYYALAHCLTADYEETLFKIYTASFTLLRNETVLVCSDGLHDALSHHQLEELWRAYHSLPDRLEALRRTVKRVPFHDDCSVAACLLQG